jgi:ABC-type transport system involved in multi-copper enzyme maturation permease subunit
MKKVWIIATNTFRENIRDRILYNLLVFALIMILMSIALVQLSTGEWQRITVDVGLSGISVFGSLMAIFLGISLVSKEIERRTIYTLLSKPVSRTRFMLGKYLGLVFTILVNLAIMVAVYLIVLYFLKCHFDWSQAQAIILILVKLLIVVAIALFFSTFTTPTLSTIYTLSIFVIGHLTNDIKTFSERAGKPLLKFFGQAIYYLIPNLSNYSWLDSATYGEIMPAKTFLLTLLAGIFTAGFILALASLILDRKDFA